MKNVMVSQFLTRSILIVPLLVCSGCGGHDPNETGAVTDEDPTMESATILDATDHNGREVDPTMPTNL